MANVKRLKMYMNTKEHLRGGISQYNMLYKCSNIVDETFGQVDISFDQSDGVNRSNKPNKEFQRFLLAFEVVEALPNEYDKLKEDLEISITGYIFKPTKFHDEWIEEASENASSKGHTVLFKEKLLP